MKDALKLKDKFNKLIIDNLPEDKLIEFDIMIAVGDKERLNEFIKSILPDIEDILSKNLKDL